MRVGDFTMLYCSTMSVPPPTFSWFFDGKPTIVHEAVYIIKSIKSYDSGTFSCTAVNTATGLTQTVSHKLRVVGMCQKRTEIYIYQWDMYISMCFEINLGFSWVLFSRFLRLWLLSCCWESYRHNSWMFSPYCNSVWDNCVWYDKEEKVSTKQVMIYVFTKKKVHRCYKLCYLKF